MKFNNCRIVHKIITNDVKKGFKRMKLNKSLEPDEIIIEVWKSLRDKGMVCLKFKNMSDEWRKSFLIPTIRTRETFKDTLTIKGLS